MEELKTKVQINENQQRLPYIEDNQRNSNIEISKPLFFGNNKDQHPIEFLQSLEEFF